ncbi:MAG: 50S ribosomal protein L22 [Planctomycetes bacterium]|nr:50S ribosomal protein L22 [Planctomycetota bacterium]
MSNFEAHHRFAHITARKARYVADLVRGKDVNRAIEILDGTHKRGSFFVSRVLKSAIANATRDGQVNANRLFVREIQVDAGPLLQGRFRFQPGPMGRALPIRKRTSHIHVVLGERQAQAGGRRGAKATAVAAAPAAAEAAPKAKATTRKSTSKKQS